LDYFGGRNPKQDFKHCSNIIFSNGELDPWHAGGVLYNVSDDCIALYINGAAHHLDLRGPNPTDTAEILSARAVETIWIQKWIAEYSAITESS
jgi:hypothetical protein